MSTCIQGQICTGMLLATFLIIGQTRNTKIEPNILQAGIDKQIVEYSQNGILFSNKKCKLLTYGTSWTNQKKTKNTVCQTKNEVRHKRVYVVRFTLYEALDQTRLIIVGEIRRVVNIEGEFTGKGVGKAASLGGVKM